MRSWPFWTQLSIGSPTAVKETCKKKHARSLAFTVGKLPVRIKFEGIYYTLQPDSFGPQWGRLLTMTTVIPHPFEKHGASPTSSIYRTSSCHRARMTDSIQLTTTSVARNRRPSFGRRQPRCTNSAGTPKRWMRSRIAANNSRGTATSAVWTRITQEQTDVGARIDKLTSKPDLSDAEQQLLDQFRQMASVS